MMHGQCLAVLAAHVRSSCSPILPLKCRPAKSSKESWNQKFKRCRMRQHPQTLVHVHRLALLTPSASRLSSGRNSSTSSSCAATCVTVMLWGRWI